MLTFLKRKKEIPANTIVSPVDGNVIKLENVKDEAFAKKMLGDGAAILPRTEYVTAPCKGRITMLCPTLHAFGITNEDGIEILVHIGVDTVNLNGKGFKKYVSEGSFVEAGELIICFDPQYLLDEKLDFTVMVLFPQITRKINIKKDGYVRRGKDRIAVYEEKGVRYEK